MEVVQRGGGVRCLRLPRGDGFSAGSGGRLRGQGGDPHAAEEGASGAHCLVVGLE